LYNLCEDLISEEDHAFVNTTPFKRHCEGPLTDKMVFQKTNESSKPKSSFESPFDLNDSEIDELKSLE
jgi:hypothetical protein